MLDIDVLHLDYIRRGRGPANMAVVKQMALKLLKYAKPTINLKIAKNGPALDLPEHVKRRGLTRRPGGGISRV